MDEIGFNAATALSMLASAGIIYWNVRMRREAKRDLERASAILNEAREGREHISRITTSILLLNFTVNGQRSLLRYLQTVSSAPIIPTEKAIVEVSSTAREISSIKDTPEGKEPESPAATRG